MKYKYFLISMVFIFCFSSVSCVVTHPGHHNHPRKEVPPGHKKKKHGRKSAKYYAPGHNKKMEYRY